MDGMAIMKIKSILKVQNENFDILRGKWKQPQTLWSECVHH